MAVFTSPAVSGFLYFGDSFSIVVSGFLYFGDSFSLVVSGFLYFGDSFSIVVLEQLLVAAGNSLPEVRWAAVAEFEGV